MIMLSSSEISNSVMPSQLTHSESFCLAFFDRVPEAFACLRLGSAGVVTEKRGKDWDSLALSQPRFTGLVEIENEGGLSNQAIPVFVCKVLLFRNRWEKGYDCVGLLS